jgi:uncharacterized repeat protein (TIGR01451 family)
MIIFVSILINFTMRYIGSLFIVIWSTFSAAAQEPCEGATGQILASGYYSTFDGYYQQCLGQSIEFVLDGVQLPEGGEINSIGWLINNVIVPNENGMSLTLELGYAYEFELSALISSSMGCNALYNLDLPVLFLGANLPLLDSTYGTCLSEGALASVDFDTSYGQQELYEANNLNEFFSELMSFSSTINIVGADVMEISDCGDLQFLRVNLEHSYSGDLDMRLTCPNGSSVSILTFPSGLGGNNFGEAVDIEGSDAGIGYDYFWSGEATMDILASREFNGLNYFVPSGYYFPAESFCNLIGCPIDGEWVLEIIDLIAIDNGYVFSWGMSFEGLPELTYDVLSSTNNEITWSSSEFDISDQTIASANINLVEDDSGFITYTITNTAGCTASDTKPYHFLDFDAVIDAGEDLSFANANALNVEGQVEFLVDECWGQSMDTLLCYGDNESSYWTFCADDYFECSIDAYLEINGALQVNSDFITVWDGIDASQEPIFTGSNLYSPLTLHGSSGCFLVNINSNDFASCFTGDFYPIEIQLHSGEELQYNWSPVDLFDSPDSMQSHVNMPLENTTAIFSVDFPNYTGCTISDSLTINIPDNTVVLTIFLDENLNGLKEEEENVVPYYPIEVAGIGTQFTNQNGQVFTFINPPIALEMFIDELQWNFTTPSLVEINSPSSGYTQEYYIGITPTENLITDIEVSIEGLNGVCNGISQAHCMVMNHGNFYPGGRIRVELDQIYQNLYYSPNPLSFGADFVLFEVPALSYHESFSALIGVNNPDESAFGEVASHTVFGYYNISENELSEVIDSDNLTYLMQCSYDPNNKITHTGVGAFNDIEANTTMEYTINFQNIGNASAERVVISDEISKLLDVSSIQPIAWSHEFTLTIENNVATFIFDPINLPGLEQDEVASKGFVRFTIKQMPDLPGGTIINNSAAIVFDNNSPIYTNTTSNRIPINIGIDDADQSELIVFPNPVEGVINWSDKNFELHRILNSLGSVVHKPTISGQNQCDISDLPAGVYTLEFVNNQKALARRVVIKH